LVFSCFESCSELQQLAQLSSLSCYLCCSELRGLGNPAAVLEPEPQMSSEREAERLGWEKLYLWWVYLSERLTALTGSRHSPSRCCVLFTLPLFPLPWPCGRTDPPAARGVRGGHTKHVESSLCLTCHRSPRLWAQLTPALGTLWQLCQRAPALICGRSWLFPLRCPTGTFL